MKSKFLILAGLSTFLFVTSCNKFEGDQNNSTYDSSINTDDKMKELTRFLSKSLKIDKSKFKFDKELNSFVIDGDCLISMEDAQVRYDNRNNKQRTTTYTVNATVAPAITIYVPSTISSTWQSAINSAITNWNAADCLVKFQLTTNASTAKITVAMYTSTTDGNVAYAYLPTFGGNPGSMVFINHNSDGILANQKIFAITHELGHTIGFHHTNQTTGNLISETPTYDANSVMNSVVSSWTGFSPYDIIASGVVYPNYPGTSRFLRYYNSSVPNHYYTLNSVDLGAGGSGYVFERPGTGYFYKNFVSGTVPLYRWFRPSTGHDFYTISNTTIGGGYISAGIAGYVHTTQVAGTRPLYRYFRNSVGDHFYTVNYSELGSGASGYALEGIECYVY